jgi:hypothetical protein
METIDDCAKRLKTTKVALLNSMWRRASDGKTTEREVKMLIHTLLLQNEAKPGSGGLLGGSSPGQYDDIIASVFGGMPGMGGR